MGKMCVTQYSRTFPCSESRTTGAKPHCNRRLKTDILTDFVKEALVAANRTCFAFRDV